MPLASSVDLVIAGAHNIMSAINYPPPGSPLAPLTDSEANVLRNLSELLSNRKPIPAPLPQPAAILRVEPPVRVPPGFPPAATVPPPTTLPQPASILRVGNPSKAPIENATVKSTQEEAIKKNVTFDESTGPKGHCNRQKAWKQARKPVPAPAEPPRYPTRSRANLAMTSADVAAAATLLNDPTFAASVEFANTAIHPDTDESVEYKALLNSSAGSLWVDGTADEIGWLASGNLLSGTTSGTETIHFIHVSQILQGKKATFLKVVVADKPNKAIKHIVRFTISGDKIDYAGDCSTKTADLTTPKCLFNGILSIPGAKFMNMQRYSLNLVVNWLLDNGVVLSFVSLAGDHPLTIGNSGRVCSRSFWNVRGASIARTFPTTASEREDTYSTALHLLVEGVDNKSGREVWRALNESYGSDEVSCTSLTITAPDSKRGSSR
jgi:hypothetical protein